MCGQGANQGCSETKRRNDVLSTPRQSAALHLNTQLRSWSQELRLFTEAACEVSLSHSPPDRLCLAGLTGSCFFEKARCTSVLNLYDPRQLEPTCDTCSHHRLTTTRWHSSIGFYSAAPAIQSPSLRQTRLLKLAVSLPPSPPPIRLTKARLQTLTRP